MRVIHSFVASKIPDMYFFIHMCYFVLSCIYAKRSGFEIALHCDKKTEYVLNIAPYDEIITDLEGFKFTKNIYAAGKFKAMQDEPLGTIHIDGDVFLKSSELIDLLSFDDYDCIVQGLEHYNIYGGNCKTHWDRASMEFKYCDFPAWANRNCKSMYNCGVVGINNYELKQEYFDTYDNMFKQYTEKGLCNTNSVPDLIIEQQFLKDITDHKKYSVKTLLPCTNIDDITSYANAIGYQHVLGTAKFNLVDKVLMIIKHYNEDIYNQLIEIKKSLNLIWD